MCTCNKCVTVTFVTVGKDRKFLSVRVKVVFFQEKKPIYLKRKNPKKSTQTHQQQI